MNQIATKGYDFGADNQANRRLDFFRLGDDPATIEARIYHIAENRLIGTIPGNRIQVEKENSIQKFHAERLGSTQQVNAVFGELTTEGQNQVLGSLQSRNIEVNPESIIISALP